MTGRGLLPRVPRGRWLIVAAAEVGALVAIVPSDWADNVLNLQFHTFQDTRGVTVLSPAGDLEKDFTDRTGLKLRFGVDAITAASDSCARCHPDGAQNRRTYVDLSLVRKYGDTTLEVGGEVSRENFYSADTGIVSVSQNLNKGNTTIAGGYSFSLNRPVMHPSNDIVEHQYAHDAFVSLTQTLTKTTIVQLSYDFNRISGYQDNPFLRALVNNERMLGVSPTLRTRHAVAVRLRQALPGNTYLEADYRRYSDSWAVGSNTVSVGMSHSFGPSWLTGFTYRWYDQTGAFFYRPQYFGNPEFFTADFKLAPFNSGLYGGRIVYTPAHGGVFGLPDRSSLEVQYERYLATTGFQAAMVSVGLHIPF